MARRHRMTPARRAALRKAQLASAAKRRRHTGAGSVARNAGARIRRGKTSRRRLARLAGHAVAAGFTPYGYVLGVSAVRNKRAKNKRKYSGKKRR